MDGINVYDFVFEMEIGGVMVRGNGRSGIFVGGVC